MADVLRERAEIEASIAGQTLGDLLLRNADENGYKKALSWKEGHTWRSLTWREARNQVLEVGAGLASLGVGRGDCVAIMAANRSEHVLADQGILHAAATSTTFYSTLAPDQIQYVAHNCSAKVAVLENRDFMEKWLTIRKDLPALEHIVLIEDADRYREVEGVLSWDELIRRGRGRLGEYEERWREATPDDPATIIYTSGTTGPPKGVVLTHQNCLYEAAAIDKMTDLPDGLTMVSYLPLAHIAERLLSIYMPLRKCVHVYFCPDVTQAKDYIQEARPDVFFGVPRVWEKMMAGISAKVSTEKNPVKRTLAQLAIDTGRKVIQHQQRREPVPFLQDLGYSIFDRLFLDRVRDRVKQFTGREILPRLQGDEFIPPVLKLRYALLDQVILSKVREAIGLERCICAASAAAPLPVDVSEFFAALGLPIMEVWGMTETTGVATGNRPGQIKIGAVGPPLPGVEVKLDSDGELLVRGPNCTPKYWKMPDATKELLGDDGWLRTGDIGKLDADGFFWIVDRKKELIITAGGKNISPANIEALIKQHELVGQALAYGDRKPYPVALITLDSQTAQPWAERNGIQYTDLSAFSKHPRVFAEVERAILQANRHLAQVEQVKRFYILPTEWTAESEELTPTMKLKRRVIHSKYKDEIEALYNR